MANCKYCQKEVSRSATTETGLCPECSVVEAAKAKMDRIGLSTALAEKTTGLRAPELVGVGYWGVENRQTIAKDIGQALLSGALGMAAPFLVKNSDYVGHLGLIVVSGEELVFVDFGFVPLNGSDADSLWITEGHLRALLQSDAAHPTQRTQISSLEAYHAANGLTLGGVIKLSLTLPVSDVLEGTATAQAIAHRLNGMSGLPTPIQLIEALLTGQPKPLAPALCKMASNSSFMLVLMANLRGLERPKQQAILAHFATFPEPFVAKVSEILQQWSEGADRLPTGKIALVLGGITGAILIAVRIIWIVQHEHELPRGSIEASPVREAFAALLFFGFILVGSLGLLGYKTKQWYRQQLQDFPRKGA